jgi:hypothetical protein
MVHKEPLELKDQLTESHSTSSTKSSDLFNDFLNSTHDSKSKALSSIDNNNSNDNDEIFDHFLNISIPDWSSSSLSHDNRKNSKSNSISIINKSDISDILENITTKSDSTLLINKREIELLSEIPKPRIKLENKNIDPISDDDDDEFNDKINDDLNKDIIHSSSPTIPVDSPSMHIFNNSDNDSCNTSSLKINKQNNLIDNSFLNKNNKDINNQNFHEPPTFASANKSITPKTENSKLTPITPAIIAIENCSTTLILPGPSKKSKIFNLLNDGLREYTDLLSNISPDFTIETRSDYLTSYLKKHGYDLKLKTVNDYISEIKNNKIDNDLQKMLNNDHFGEEFRALLNESTKRRKCYNKRKNPKFILKKSLSIPNILISNTNKNLISSSILNNNDLNNNSNTSNLKLLPKVNPSQQDNTKLVIVKNFKIGVLLNQRKFPTNNIEQKQKFIPIIDLNDIIRRKEDETYLNQLKNSSISLKKCIEDIYIPTLEFTHSLTYASIPLILNPLININLENDQLMSFVEIILNINNLIIPQSVNFNSNSNLNFSTLLQLKSITRIYDDSKLIYKRSDPITGVFTKENNFNIKIMLPLQAKLWSSLINDYHNGIIDNSKFNNLKISHTIFSNDDMIKFKNENIPIHSFIWEFLVNIDDHYSPHCINIVKNNELKFQNRVPILPHQIPVQQKEIEVSPLNQNSNNNSNKLLSQQNYYRSQQRSYQLNNKRKTNFSNNFNSNQTQFLNIIEDQILTSTPNPSMIRGHKRTRSRSMNEIDLISFTVPFDGNVNIPFLDSYTPTNSNSSVSPVINSNFSASHNNQYQHHYSQQQQQYQQQHHHQYQHQYQYEQQHKHQQYQFKKFKEKQNQFFELKHQNYSDSHLELNNLTNESNCNSLNLNSVSLTNNLNFTQLNDSVNNLTSSGFVNEPGENFNSKSKFTRNSNNSNEAQFSFMDSNLIQSAPSYQTNFLFDGENEIDGNISPTNYTDFSISKRSSYTTQTSPFTKPKK